MTAIMGSKIAAVQFPAMWTSQRRIDLARISRAVANVELPEAVWRTCPWQPRELIETGLRQWLRCAGAALRDHQVIGMPSYAVDEAWHGFILCTARYAAFCADAFGRFLHHHPEGGAPAAHDAGTMADQLGRAIVAWHLVADAGEECVLWDLDERVGVESPTGGAGPARRERAGCPQYQPLTTTLRRHGKPHRDW